MIYYSTVRVICSSSARSSAQRRFEMAKGPFQDLREQRSTLVFRQTRYWPTTGATATAPRSAIANGYAVR